MRRSLVVAVFLAALVCSASAAGAPLFIVTGKGWGHGIGMSQWGAQGLARHGSTYRQILAHYYRGTSVRGGYGRTVGVLLASGRSALSVGSDAAFTVTSRGRTYRMRAGTHTIRPSLVITDVNGKKRDLASPATFRRGTRPIEHAGDRYRGVLVVRSTGSALSAANRLTLDGYVKGVVPREMPSDWLLQALKSQAVAARSYALATGGHCSFGGKPVFCATISDQVYGGIEAETPTTNRAVDATAGEAVVYGGAVASTFFFSTSGGKTSSKHDEWGGARIPYLVSVRDPYDSISYHHFWGPRDRERDCERTVPDCVFTARQLRARLGLAFTPRDLTVGARNRSSRVEYVNAVGPTTRQVSGAAMRSRLGLRSSWFSVGVISLVRAGARVTYGNRTTVRGLARGVLRPRLQRKPYGGGWVDLGPIDPTAEGRWSRGVRPGITTSYRVVTGKIAGIARTVYVAARVNFFDEPIRRDQLRGVVRPAKEGARVAVQKKKSDGTWATVATTTTNSVGEFTARFGVTNGTYRAVARLGAGYVAGTSLPLVITA
jgi:stage II sporulation protein D